MGKTWLIERRAGFIEIFRDVAQIFFAVLFLAPIVSGEATTMTIITGLFFSLTPWIVSLFIDIKTV